MQNDHEALAKETTGFKDIPAVRKVSAEDIQEDYLRIKADIRNLIANELPDVEEDPDNEEGEATVSM